MNSNATARSAFTLIELMSVVIILAIIAGVALPKFFDHQARASEAACRGTLGGVRSGIANFYANRAISTGTAAYPSLTELTDGSTMQEALPENPYKERADVIAATQAQAGSRTVIGGGAGWAYYNGSAGGSAVFYANSNDVGENLF